jgi:hypothetical protein
MPERPRARDRYEHHPLAEMFPLLKDAEFHELVEDIRKARPTRANQPVRTKDHRWAES